MQKSANKMCDLFCCHFFSLCKNEIIPQREETGMFARHLSAEQEFGEHKAYFPVCFLLALIRSLLWP